MQVPFFKENQPLTGSSTAVRVHIQTLTAVEDPVSGFALIKYMASEIDKYRAYFNFYAYLLAKLSF
jgi:hypothetical protein